MKVHIGNYVSWIGPYQIADYFKHLNIFITGAQYVFNAVVWMIGPFLSPTFAPALIRINQWFESKKFEDYQDERLHKLGEFFAHGFAKEIPRSERRAFHDDRPHTWLYKLCTWIHEKKKRKIKVKIDDWDTWSLDATLAIIILPMLKQLKATHHGSGYIELEDVPEEMRYNQSEEYDAQSTFEFYHEDGVEKKECDVHTRYAWFLDELIWTFEQLQPDCDWEDQYRSGEIDFRFEPCEDNPNLSQLVRGSNDTHKVDYAGMEAHQARISNGLRLFGKYFQTLWD